MLGYEFYCTKFNGCSIPNESFSVYIHRATQELERIKRLYTVTGTDKAFQLAVCAVADVLYYFDNAINGQGKSVSIGSVSESGASVDVSIKAQKKEIYSAVCLYLDVYRGVNANGCN